MKQAEALQALTVTEAANTLCSLIEPRQFAQNIKLHEALGRVLAVDYITPFPMPPFRRAAMDGYAVRSEDIVEAAPNNPVTLSVLGEIKAGHPLSLDGLTQQQDQQDQAKPSYMQRTYQPMPVPRRGSARIYTGAPVPDECDTLIVQEAISQDQQQHHLNRISVNKAYRQGDHIAEAGEDIVAGTKVLARGKTLRAKEIAILAAYGQGEVAVYEKPRVTVIPIGDELLTPGQSLIPYHIYDANSHMIAARLQELGANVQLVDPLPDQLETIASALTRSLEQSDVIITIGGVSVGDYDFVAQAAEKAGGVPLFRKVLMRPGKPTSSFKVGNKLMISLSGNPSACYVGLELFVKPTILKAAGSQHYENRYIQATLTGDVKGCPFTRYIRSNAYWQGDKLCVDPLGNDKSGNIAAFSHANALAVIPSGAKGAVRGEVVSVLQLDCL